MSRADEVRELLARPGATQASAAAELSISQSRVSRLASGKTGNESRTHMRTHDMTHNPDPGDTHMRPAGVQPPDATTQPFDPAALREQVIAELRAQIREQERGLVRAAFESRWNALSAERDDLRRQLTAAGPGSCPDCAALQADYEALEAERDGLRRELSAWEDPC